MSVRATDLWRLSDLFPGGLTRVTESRRPQFLNTWTSPRSCCECVPPHTTASSRVSDLRERSGGSCNASCDLVCEVNHHLFSYILFTRSESPSPAHTKGMLNTISWREEYQWFCGYILNHSTYLVNCPFGLSETWSWTLFYSINLDFLPSLIFP